MINSSEKKSKLTLIAAMFIFGTIGIFRRYIPLPSAMLAMARGLIGTIFLLLYVLIKGMRPSMKAIKSNLLLLCVSGVLIGFNWILLFESYQYTPVATATLCYYMAPIIVILVSPIFLKESLTLKKVACIVIALIGMILVSGVLRVGFSGISELKGIILGLAAAVFYASVIILNKKIRDISAYDKTIMQLGTATLVLLPYTFLTEQISSTAFTPLVVFMLLIVGIVHTGIAYVLYFGSMKDLKAQIVALFSYIDPVVAIILSALLLHESMGIPETVGAVLVLCATMISEMPDKKEFAEV